MSDKDKAPLRKLNDPDTLVHDDRDPAYLLQLPMTMVEMDALGQLAEEQDLPTERVMIQALRLYQCIHLALKEGRRVEMEQESKMYPGKMVMVSL